MKEETIKVDFKQIKKIFNNIFSKVDDFFSHRDNIAFCVFIILLSFIHEYFKISQETWELFFSIWLILFLIYFFIFNLEKTEQFLLNKITWILLIAIITIIKYQTFFWIENKDVFFMIWALFAFWYWYKKYERDKELEFIERFEQSKNINIIEWIQAINLLEKWYISNELFNIIYKSNWIKLINSIDHIATSKDLNQWILENFSELISKASFFDELWRQVLSMLREHKDSSEEIYKNKMNFFKNKEKNEKYWKDSKKNYLLCKKNIELLERSKP